MSARGGARGGDNGVIDPTKGDTQASSCLQMVAREVLLAHPNLMNTERLQK